MGRSQVKSSRRNLIKIESQWDSAVSLNIKTTSLPPLLNCHILYQKHAKLHLLKQKMRLFQLRLNTVKKDVKCIHSKLMWSTQNSQTGTLGYL